MASAYPSTMRCRTAMMSSFFVMGRDDTPDAELSLDERGPPGGRRGVALVDLALGAPIRRRDPHAAARRLVGQRAAVGSPGRVLVRPAALGDARHLARV